VNYETETDKLASK